MVLVESHLDLPQGRQRGPVQPAPRSWSGGGSGGTNPIANRRRHSSAKALASALIPQAAEGRRHNTVPAELSASSGVKSFGRLHFRPQAACVG